MTKIVERQSSPLLLVSWFGFGFGSPQWPRNISCPVVTLSSTDTALYDSNTPEEIWWIFAEPSRAQAHLYRLDVAAIYVMADWDDFKAGE